MSVDSYWLEQEMLDTYHSPEKMEILERFVKEKEEERVQLKEQRRGEVIANMMQKYCPAIGGEKCKGESCVCFKDNGASILCRNYQTASRYAD